MVRHFPVHRPLLPNGSRPRAHLGGGLPETSAVNSSLSYGSVFIPPIPIVLCQHMQLSHPVGVFYGANPLKFDFTLILLELILIVSISRLIRFLLKPFRQPKIVSDILGGIVIGPSVLGRYESFAAYMFPANSQYVAKNIGIIGFMYFLFVSGVKIDLKIMRHSGRREFYIALFGIIVPVIAVVTVGAVTRKSMTKEMQKLTSIGSVATSLAITTIPVLYPILKELNLLSSEVGRMALSSCIIVDVIGINAIVVFEAAWQAEQAPIDALWYMVSVVIVAAFTMICIRKVMVWIVQSTPEGKPVGQGYVVAILVGVLVMGFLTDMFGIAIANGPLWLGLVIPDGPPLGSTLVDRSETIMTELFLPFSYAFVGLLVDARLLRVSWPFLRPLMYMFVTGYVSKVVGILAVALFFRMPFKDGLTLGLIMSLRGQMEIILICHWLDKKLIQTPSFTLCVFLTTAMTAVATPMISFLYDPTRPYMVNRRRTLQHSTPDTELGILACVHDQASVNGVIKLLEFSNPSETSPFRVHALHLVELIGRATPMLIDHSNAKEFLRYTGHDIDTIRTTLEIYQATKGDDVMKVNVYTSVTPKRSMYQDICELALDNRATLIILPFHRDPLSTRGLVRRGVNERVLANAPCSAAVLVDKSQPSRQHERSSEGSSFRGMILPHTTRRHVAMLFHGGGDAREGLVYADRMVGREEVWLTVIRFLSANCEGDDEAEKKLDDEVVTWFWVKNECNDRVLYREVVVRNGQETVAAIRAMEVESIDMWVVGRRRGINPVIVEGLADGGENLELGVLGGFLSSVEFGGTGSVLVVHQQVLRGQRRRFICC